MERQNRRELLQIIEQQKEQLGRYEARLKDVVRAYKGLSKEKETLETSLKAITAAAQPEKTEDGAETEPDASDVESLADSQASADTVNFKSKLGALSANLASLSQEKAQNETKFLAERRRFKKEKEELSSQINSFKASEESLRKNLEEVKSKLIVEKHEREQETNNTKLMMKELQKLLADERNLKESIAEELHNRKSEGTLLQPGPLQAEGPRLGELEKELEAVRVKLENSEQQLRDQNTTKQQLRQLQQELFEVRQQHQEQLRSAEVAREEAELRAIDIQQQQEHRVGNLESRLQELSSSLADYQRLRESDQSDIFRMRTKIDALSDENTALARAVSVEPPAEEVSSSVDSLEPQHILEKVRTLKQTLLERNLDHEVLEQVFSLPVHTDLRRRVDELEKLANTEAKEQKPTSGLYEDFLASTAHVAQLENVKAQNELLKSKLSDCRTEMNSLKEELKEKSKEFSELKQKTDTEKEVLRLESRKQVGILKFELQQQRETSLALLEEKDAEIQRLIGEVEQSVEEAFFSPKRGNSSSPMALPSRKVSCDIGEMNAGSASSGAPLHYVQELSRKDIEIKDLRSMALQTETTLRELQYTMSTKEEKYQEKIEDLEVTISRLERMTTTEGSNLEYLKNVVLTYMLSTDVKSRNHMLKAIGAVLKLSKSEIKRVMEHNSSWWWSQQSAQSAASAANK